MNRLQGCRYIPVLRTREAELRGLENVSSADMDYILPVIEFTRSRRSKTHPSGPISKSVAKAHEILEGRPYIADLTTMSAQTSAEIESLLDPLDSFKNWTDFVASSLPKNCIPSVHLTEPFDANVFATQIGRLWATNSGVAIRIPVDYPHLEQLAASISPVQSGAVVVLADASYVRPSQQMQAIASCGAVLRAFAGKAHLGASVCSSFPNSVTVPEYGGADDHGKFDLVEVAVSEQIKHMGLGPMRTVHGDYALIHPLDFDGTVTNWVPRVDVPLDRSVFYHRIRRPQGGYVVAAARALADTDYVPLQCWGHDNIVQAAGGAPLGRSPAHWIAVRLNFHISRQIARLR